MDDDAHTSPIATESAELPPRWQTYVLNLERSRAYNVSSIQKSLRYAVESRALEGQIRMLQTCIDDLDVPPLALPSSVVDRSPDDAQFEALPVRWKDWIRAHEHAYNVSMARLMSMRVRTSARFKASTTTKEGQELSEALQVIERAIANTEVPHVEPIAESATLLSFAVDHSVERRACQAQFSSLCENLCVEFRLGRPICPLRTDSA